MKNTTAKFIKEISVTDPDTGNEINVAIYKELESGGMFGVDSSYVEDVLDEDKPEVPSVFNNGICLLLD